MERNELIGHNGQPRQSEEKYQNNKQNEVFELRIEYIYILL